MICVAISDKDPEKCIELLSKSEMAEIRIDLCEYSLETIERVFSHQTPTIATCRAENTGLEVQKKSLIKAIESGADFVDVEIEVPEEQRREIIAHAHKNRCKVIISYHNYEETPGLRELYSIVDQFFEAGADIAKIATMVNSSTDNARLMALYSINRPVVVFGMGEVGKVTRIIAPMLGAGFSFAATDNGQSTAPGQISYSEMKELFEHINKTLNYD